MDHVRSNSYYMELQRMNFITCIKHTLKTKLGWKVKFWENSNVDASTRLDLRIVANAKYNELGELDILRIENPIKRVKRESPSRMFFGWNFAIKKGFSINAT